MIGTENARVKGWIAAGLITAVCAIPVAIGLGVVCDPLGRRRLPEWVVVATLENLPVASGPRRVPVLVAQSDAWTTLPDRLVGEVFLNRTADRNVAALKTHYHIGAGVEFDAAAGEFHVPCWKNIRFDITGRRLHPHRELGDIRPVRSYLEGDTVSVRVPDVVSIDNDPWPGR